MASRRPGDNPFAQPSSTSSNPFEDHPPQQPSNIRNPFEQDHPPSHQTGVESFFEDDEDFGHAQASTSYRAPPDTTYLSPLPTYAPGANRFGISGSSDTFEQPFASSGAAPAGFADDRHDLTQNSSRFNRDDHSEERYGDIARKQKGLNSNGKAEFEEGDEIDNLETLSWDFADSSGGRAGGPPLARFQKPSFVESVRYRLSTFDYTLGLGAGSLSDFMTSLPFLGRREGPSEPRAIYLNDGAMNGNGRGAVRGTENEGRRKWGGNSVSTSKYNVVTFLPVFLYEQFSKYANIFFLFTACIQQVPGVSPTSRWTTIIPLAIVLAASAAKELEEDLKRHASDRQLNGSQTKILDLLTSAFACRPWRAVRVGDILRLEDNDFIPADLVLIASSEPEGLCYVETSNLDGETNLKIKQASSSTSHLTNPAELVRVSGMLQSEAPNSSLYTYEGTLTLRAGFEGGQEKRIPMGPDQLLLRGAQIRNSNWVYGLVIGTGHDTKLLKNASQAPIKRTNVEKQVNSRIIILFALLVLLSLVSTVGGVIRTWFFDDKAWYLSGSQQGNKARQFVQDLLTFWLLYSNLIPISLVVTMEVVKYQQAALINSDLDMYYAKTDTPALCRTSSLVEELGQIEFIFSDKTGTLTCNEMEFKECSIAGTTYAAAVDDAKREQGQQTFEELENRGRSSTEEGTIIREFLTLLAVCHTVIPEVKNGQVIFQASSPDEAALVSGAEMLGYRFHIRKPRSVFVDIGGENTEFQILNVCEFNSSRKRMSAIIRSPDGKIKIYTKGADTVIFERLAPAQALCDVTLAHLEDYATEGLRTLCLAMRDIPEDEYAKWSAMYDAAASQINGRQEALEKAAEIIEQNLVLLGATAIEDKLQEGVPDAIHTLQQAGIKIWVLTGDRQETAINIGLSCRLIAESMNLVIVNEQSSKDTYDFLTKRLFAIKNQRNAGDTEELALIIDGKSLGFALEGETSEVLLELALMCKAVICCRVSPLQKALVVKLVKRNSSAILLAIGDGANDVSMIQAAHIGVGISGVEGLQAARSADVAISQFRFLKKLLLVHGAWSYQRVSKLVLYYFYKNIVLYMTQFWFSLYNNYSGQVAYESWTWLLYNIAFTVLPPFVIGVFDQFVSARMLDRYPQLYSLGQKNSFFTPVAFWQWVGNAFYHSLLLFLCSIAVFWGDLKTRDGLDTGLWFWGTTLYLMVLLTVLGKAAIISDVWTKYTVAAIPGSFVFTMAFLPLYAIIAPAIGFSLEYQGIVPRLWGDSMVYLCLLVFPAACLLRDYIWKYYGRTYTPKSYHIVQEIQKFNLSDYRPRQEQFQKAIKKVRATQRMRRQRGFAFSQTEGGMQDQSNLIRVYDTENRERPTGY